MADCNRGTGGRLRGIRSEGYRLGRAGARGPERGRTPCACRRSLTSLGAGGARPAHARAAGGGAELRRFAVRGAFLVHAAATAAARARSRREYGARGAYRAAASLSVHRQLHAQWTGAGVLPDARRPGVRRAHRRHAGQYLQHRQLRQRAAGAHLQASQHTTTTTRRGFPVTNVWRRASGALIILTLIAGCAADRLHREGLAAIERGDYEAGVAELNQAVVREPGNMAYRLDFEARRESALQSLIAAGDNARRAGQLDAATALYRRVLAISPSNDRARHGLEGVEGDKRHGGALEAAHKDFDGKDYDAAESKVRAILQEDPGYVPAQELAAAINVARGPVTVAPRLQTRENRKVTLQLRDAPTKMVFEVLQRETGINFILDKDVKSDTKTSIFVQDVPVDEAIDLVLDQNQLARQILADNMVMIYPNTAAKQKDYEQQIVRTFYLTNATPKDVEGMLKSVLAAKTLFIDERSNVLVMRDTPDAVRMAEKLVASV